MVIFIKRVLSIYQLLPTHFFLAAHGSVARTIASFFPEHQLTILACHSIVPSTTKQYKLADIQKAIISATVSAIPLHAPILR